MANARPTWMPVSSLGLSDRWAEWLRARPRPSWLATVAALGWLWVCTLVFFDRALLAGAIYHGFDTRAYYLPVQEVYGRSLSDGDLPFWTPHVYGGFPLFAEGEGGMLYPINVALTWLLPPGLVPIWEPIARFGLAGSFAFGFARVLGLAMLSSVVAGLVFTFGSFLVCQLPHTNVGNSALWLPAVLSCAELAARHRAVGRFGWMALGSLALGMAMLAVHVQPVLITLLVLALWCLFRAGSHFVAGCPHWSLKLGPGEATLRWSRCRPAAWVEGIRILALAPVIAVVALGVAAAQLVPLGELSRFSFRGAGASYQFASEYGPAPVNLIGLLFPMFFRGADERWWTLWPQHESTIYVGVTTLTLGAAGALFPRAREPRFFAALAIVGLLLALGDYSPLNLFWLVWHLPGFSSLRAPGRFSVLFVFATAMLAGYGMQWLLAQARPDETAASPTRRRWRLSGLLVRVRLLALGIAAGTLGLLWALVAARRWLQEDRERALALIDASYLSLRRDPAFRVSSDFILDSVEDGLDPTSPRTALGLTFLGATALYLAGWTCLRRPAWLWPGLLVVLITVDLLSFGRDFHPTATVAELTRAEGAARFLADQPGLHRHLHLAWPPITTQPNRLVPLSRSDAGGYSSLASDRIQAYLDRATAHDGVLLDLINVRYVLAPTKRQARPEHQGVQYDVDRPLSAGAAANPNSVLELAADGARADELRLIGFLRQARGVLQGTQVGSVRVHDSLGRDHHFPLVAGENIADELAESAVLDGSSHRPVQVAYERRWPGADGDQARTRGYVISLPFGAKLTVDDVTVTYFSPEGQLQIVGGGLVGGQGAVTQLSRRTKYRPVHEDEDWTVYENLRVMPRAFLAYDAVAELDGGATRDLLAAGPFDARRQVVLDRAPPSELRGVPPELAEVTIEAYEDRRVALSARTGAPAILVLTDAMYPGWHAAVDGTEAPMLTADSIFRGVYLAPGEHRIEFTFDPASFKLGATISLGTLGLLAVLGVAALRVRRARTIRQI